MTTEQEHAEFAEWLYGINSPIDVTECDSKDIEMMYYAYQAGRAAGIRDGRNAAYDCVSRIDEIREDGL